jgi:hypothetical protein
MTGRGSHRRGVQLMRGIFTRYGTTPLPLAGCPTKQYTRHVMQRTVCGRGCSSQPRLPEPQTTRACADPFSMEDCGRCTSTPAVNRCLATCTTNHLPCGNPAIPGIGHHCGGACSTPCGRWYLRSGVATSARTGTSCRSCRSSTGYCRRWAHTG